MKYRIDILRLGDVVALFICLFVGYKLPGTIMPLVFICGYAIGTLFRLIERAS